MIRNYSSLVLVFAALQRFQGLSSGRYRKEVNEAVVDIYEHMKKYQKMFNPADFNKRVSSLEKLMEQLGIQLP